MWQEINGCKPITPIQIKESPRSKKRPKRGPQEDLSDDHNFSDLRGTNELASFLMKRGTTVSAYALHCLQPQEYSCRLTHQVGSSLHTL
jgi:hypothetical protein